MRQEHKLKRYNFILTTLQKAKLDNYSKQSGLSLSDIVRRAIDEYLEGKFDKPTPAQRREKNVSHNTHKS
ncbi:MAG: ribbon-helix-helix domain-containing protein [Candidatus Poribacteria bacterium]